MHIIHFTTLEDLLDDAPVGASLYVCQQITTRFDHDQHGVAYRVTTAHAFARIAADNAVLSYTPYIQQVSNMELVDPKTTRTTHNQINRRAMAIAASMLNYLQNAGYATRKAIVDLHGAKPVQGHAWPLSEEEEQREQEYNHHEPT